jgi:dsDNA-specific endonuclease/ATPase MutS2
MGSTSSWLEKHKRTTTRFIGPTISLRGLGVEDALRFLDTKLSRAAQTGAVEIRIVFDRTPSKMKSAIVNYLESSNQVAQYDEHQAPSGLILIRLNPPTTPLN